MRRCKEKCPLTSEALLPYVPAKDESAKMYSSHLGGKTTFRGVPFRWDHVIIYLPSRDERSA